MIKQLTVHNFQNHRDTTLDLHSGINVIVGSSDVGKSALIRAIEWIRTNRPLGTSFLRHGMRRGEGCFVELACVPRGGKRPIKVRRSRGKAVNQYTVGNNSMKAIGSDVPSMVAEVLNLGDVNVQAQLSPHFLILDSPGAVAKAINAAVHLEEMDQCVSEAQRRTRAIRSAIEAGKENVDELVEEIAGFKDLEQAAAIYRKAEDCYKEVVSLGHQWRELEAVTVDLLKVEKQLVSVPPAELVNQVLVQVDSVLGVQAECSGLGELIGQCRTVGKSLQLSREATEKAKKELGEALEGSACPVCGRLFDEDSVKHVMVGG